MLAKTKVWILCLAVCSCSSSPADVPDDPRPMQALTTYLPSALMVASLDGASEDGTISEPVAVQGHDQEPTTHVGFTLNDATLNQLLNCLQKNFNSTTTEPQLAECYAYAQQYMALKNLTAPTWRIEMNNPANVYGHCWRAGGWSDTCGNFTPRGFVLLRLVPDTDPPVYQPYVYNKIRVDQDPDPAVRNNKRMNVRFYINVQAQ